MAENVYHDGNGPVRRFDSYSNRDYINTKSLSAGQKVVLKDTYSIREFVLTSIDPLRGRSVQDNFVGQIYRIPKNAIVEVLA